MVLIAPVSDYTVYDFIHKTVYLHTISGSKYGTFLYSWYTLFTKLHH